MFIAPPTRTPSSARSGMGYGPGRFPPANQPIYPIRLDDLMECAGRAQRRRRFGFRWSGSLWGDAWRLEGALRAGGKRRRRFALPAHSIIFGLLLWGATCGRSPTCRPTESPSPCRTTSLRNRQVGAGPWVSVSINMPLLTELAETVVGSGCYKHAAPDGAFTSQHAMVMGVATTVF